jgi:CitMHS family citrate-Mg2+:H+ or citrate-Ca2+:H+ symporter
LLALAGFAMVAAFMILIMSKRLAPGVALILIPIIVALLLGESPRDIGEMALDGIKALAPTGVMLMFAILYFGLMIDAGLFEPVVRRIVAMVDGDPLKVVVGSAVLAAFVSLDGDGSTTYMITIAAMLPLYQRLGMNALSLTCVTMLASGVMNLTPWGGPLARAASALHVDTGALFVPMLPSMLAGIVGVLAIAWHLGKRERTRLNFDPNAPLGLEPTAEEAAARIDQAPVGSEGPAITQSAPGETEIDHASHARPKLLLVNAGLTILLMIALIAGLLPIPLLFMIGFSVALIINYPNPHEQRIRLVAHSGNVISVVSIIFAAGVFTGILNGTGMVTAMSGSFVSLIPPSLGPYMAPITAAASLPFTFFISNDAFYFGMLPVIAEAAGQFDVAKLELARASLIGQPVHLLSPLVPSTFLLVGLAGVELGDHQRFTLKWAVLVCLIMALIGMMTGAFMLRG